jgi:membrane protein involved in colicin uptake
MDPIEISREEYAELQKRPTPEELAAEKQRADKAEQEKADAEKLAEEKEAEAKQEKERADAAEKKVSEAEEEKAKDTLGKERLGKLGKGFVAKLGDFTRERVEDQARTLSDDDWEARLKELEETTSVKRDEGGTEPSKEDRGGKGGEFTREETARASLGGGEPSGTGEEPSPESRRSVMSGLMPKRTPVKAANGDE